MKKKKENVSAGGDIRPPKILRTDNGHGLESALTAKGVPPEEDEELVGGGIRPSTLQLVTPQPEPGRPWFLPALEAEMSRAGINKSDVARKAKIGKSTISTWFSGGEPPNKACSQLQVIKALQDFGVSAGAIEQLITHVMETGGTAAKAMRKLMDAGKVAKYAGAENVRLTIQEASMKHEILTRKTMEHFNVNQQPFTELQSRAEVVLWPELSAFVDRIADAIIGSTSMIVITGPTGAGKTTAMRFIAEKLEQDFNCKVLSPAMLDLTGLNEATLQSMILQAAGERKLVFADQHSRGFKARQALAKMRKESKVVVWVDQAEDLTDDGMILLKRLNEEREGWMKLVSVVVTGQPQVRDHFANVRNKQFAIRSEVHDMPAIKNGWTYIENRLRNAGMNRADIERAWPQEACAAFGMKVKALEKGGAVTPRQLENLAARIMNKTCAVGDKAVSAAMVEHVQDAD